MNEPNQNIDEASVLRMTKLLLATRIGWGVAIAFTLGYTLFFNRDAGFLLLVVIAVSKTLLQMFIDATYAYQCLSLLDRSEKKKP